MAEFKFSEMKNVTHWWNLPIQIRKILKKSDAKKKQALVNFDNIINI